MSLSSIPLTSQNDTHAFEHGTWVAAYHERSALCIQAKRLVALSCGKGVLNHVVAFVFRVHSSSVGGGTPEQ